MRVAHAPGMPGKFSPPPRVCDPGMHHGTCVTHVLWCMPGSLISGFIWGRWRGKRFRHFRCRCNPQFYVSGKRPVMYSIPAMACVVCNGFSNAHGGNFDDRYIKRVQCLFKTLLSFQYAFLIWLRHSMSMALTERSKGHHLSPWSDMLIMYTDHFTDLITICCSWTHKSSWIRHKGMVNNWFWYDWLFPYNKLFPLAIWWLIYHITGTIKFIWEQ